MNVHDAIARIQQGIESLHKKTKAATFYELFNLSEIASRESIKKKYHQGLKSKFPIEGLSQDDSDQLLTEGYNILTMYKDTYDYYLKYHYYPIKTRAVFWLIALLVLSCVVFADICFMIYKNVRQSKMSKKEVKRAMRAGRHVNGISFRELFLVRMIVYIKRKFVG